MCPPSFTPPAPRQIVFDHNNPDSPDYICPVVLPPQTLALTPDSAGFLPLVQSPSQVSFPARLSDTAREQRPLSGRSGVVPRAPRENGGIADVDNAVPASTSWFSRWKRSSASAPETTGPRATENADRPSWIAEKMRSFRTKGRQMNQWSIGFDLGIVNWFRSSTRNMRKSNAPTAAVITPAASLSIPLPKPAPLEGWGAPIDAIADAVGQQERAAMYVRLRETGQFLPALESDDWPAECERIFGELAGAGRTDSLPIASPSESQPRPATSLAQSDRSGAPSDIGTAGDRMSAFRGAQREVLRNDTGEFLPRLETDDWLADCERILDEAWNKVRGHPLSPSHVARVDSPLSEPESLPPSPTAIVADASFGDVDAGPVATLDAPAVSQQIQLGPVLDQALALQARELAVAVDSAFGETGDHAAHEPLVSLLISLRDKQILQREARHQHDLDCLAQRSPAPTGFQIDTLEEALLKDIERVPATTGEPLQRLIDTLALVADGDPVRAHAALAYLDGIDLQEQICADHRLAAAVPEQEAAQALAWRTVQALASAERGVRALKMVAKKEHDIFEKYEFFEPVLIVYLKQAQLIADRNGTARPRDPATQLAVPGAETALMHAGLTAAAKRLAYAGPWLSEQQAERLGFGGAQAARQGLSAAAIVPGDGLVDGQPDLAHLSLAERYHFSAARNGITEDGPATIFGQAERRMEKWLHRYAIDQRNFHKNPIRNLIDDAAANFSVGGDMAKLRPAHKLCVNLLTEVSRRIDSGAGDRTERIGCYVREAILKNWVDRTWIDLASAAKPFSAADRESILHHLTTRLANNADAESIVIADLGREWDATMLENGQHIQPEILESWLNAVDNAHADSAVSADWAGRSAECAELLLEYKGTMSLQANFPQKEDSAAVRIEKAGEVVRATLSKSSIGSGVLGSDSQVRGVSTKNLLFESLSIPLKVVPVQVRVTAAWSHSKEADVAFGWRGSGGFFSVLHKRQRILHGGVGGHLGWRFGSAGAVGFSTGVGADYGVTEDQSNSEGIEFLKKRGEDEPARGTAAFRPKRGAGDVERTAEFGSDMKDVMVGPPADADGGLSRIRYGMALHPDRLDVTLISRDDDQNRTLSNIATYRAVLVGVSVGHTSTQIGATYSQAWGNNKTRRFQRGSAMSIESDISQKTSRGVATIGATLSQSYAITEIDNTGIGSTAPLSASIGLYDRGKSIKIALTVSGGVVVKNSNRLVTFDSAAAYVADCRENLETISDNMAKHERERQRKSWSDDSGPLPELEQFKREATNTLLAHIEKVERDASRGQTYQRFNELTQSAYDAINELYADREIARALGLTAQADAAQQAITALSRDDASWSLLFDMVKTHAAEKHGLGPNLGIFVYKIGATEADQLTALVKTESLPS